MSIIPVWLRSLFYRKLIGTILPVSWFAPAPPSPLRATPIGEQHRLQIVSHCWQYSHLLVYQLDSLVRNPPSSATLTYTLFYAEEDTGTASLVQRYKHVDVPNLQWDWQALPREELFRRSIGRNLAAKNSEADWVWFTDCDTLFLDGCVDSWDSCLQGRQAILLYPAFEKITPLLESTDDILQRIDTGEQPLELDDSIFEHNDIVKAKGAFQIVHGDACRALGYCDGISLYQSPTNHWRKTFEDTFYRKLLRSEGEAIPIQGLYRIRHIEKGRYQKDSQVSKLRKSVRRRDRSR